MSGQSYKYIIIGAGLGGVSAIEGIRQVDARGSILLLGREKDAPYDRPPLTKQLWNGTKRVEEVWLHDQEFYRTHNVVLRLGAAVEAVDVARHSVRDTSGNTLQYERLLLTTGGRPNRLVIPGGNLEGLFYYRTLADYRRLRGAAVEGRSALVIGGGFIGSEIAAALRTNNLSVSMLFPSSRLVSRVFPEALGRYLTGYYQAKGVQILSGDVPLAITREGTGYLTKTRSGREVRTDLVVIGVGISPEIALASAAGLQTGDGVIVNEYLQTSHPDVYAAGDAASFPEAVLGRTRIEHWDNALAQGKHAGRNMAGAREPFTYLPFFFSDLFEFGYEAVGRIDSRMETYADWQEEHKTGVIYYLEQGHVRGAMMCNVWGKVDAARALIREAQPMDAAHLRGLIK
jgi:NADPH-dependent 2,4-dienoyl-CoA reductase/sulfur reductase-like enzyme